MTVDTTAPTITSVAVASNNSTNTLAKEGNTITFKVAFSEAVVLSTASDVNVPFTINGGSPQYATAQSANSATINGTTNAINFNYTVPSSATGAVALVAGELTLNNGATVLDSATNALTGNMSSLTGSVTIDTTAPTISSVAVASNNTNSAFAKETNTITFKVAFSEAVVLSTASDVKVPFKIDGGDTQYAIAQSTTTATIGSTNNAINFNYTVPSSVNGAVALVAGALTLSNSATVKDTATNALTGNMSSLTGSVTVDTTAPTISYVAVASDNSNTAFAKESNIITFKVGFSEAVILSNASDVKVPFKIDGGDTQYAVAASTNTATINGTTNAINFNYTVPSSVNGSVALVAGALTLTNSATVIDIVGASNSLTGNMSNLTGTMTVDTTAPTITSVAVASDNTNSAFSKEADIITFKVGFSEAIVLSNASDVKVPFKIDGGDTQFAIAQSTTTATIGSTNNAINFNYTVPSSVNGAVALVAGALTITNSATILDTATNSLSGNMSSLTGSMTIDTITPTISTIAVASNNTYSNLAKEGNTITFKVGFSEAVVLSTASDVKVPFKIDEGDTQFAVAQSTNTSTIGGTTNAINFNYSVPSSVNGTVALVAGALTLSNSATVIDNVGASNPLSGNMSSLTGTMTVDTTSPTISYIAVVSNNSTNTAFAKESNTITFKVGFSETVTLSSASDVKVPFTIGGGLGRSAVAQSTTTATLGGTANAINFTYTVPSGVNGSVALVAGALTLSNSATVVDAATNALSGNMSSLTGSMTVDTTVPTISSVAVASNNATTTLAVQTNIITFKVGFSEAVTLSTASDVKVPFTIDGGSTQYAVAQSTTTTTINGTSNAINFNYTVPSSVNGSVALVAGALTLSNSATIIDNASNLLTGNMSSLIGSMTVDTTSPFITITSTTTGVSNETISNDSSIVLQFSSTEDTNNFASGDITVSGGTISDFSGSDSTYTCTLTPDNVNTDIVQETTINIAENVYTDVAGNDNIASSQFKWTYDNQKPIINSVSISNDNEFLTVNFSKEVFNSDSGSGNLEVSDFELSIQEGTATLGSQTPLSILKTENSYRLDISLIGIANGQEILSVIPSSSTSIYSAYGVAASTTQSNNTIQLNNLSPSISCFTKDSLVKTNQGLIKIQNIDVNKHTINGKKIHALTVNYYHLDSEQFIPFLVFIKKDSLFKNYPIKDTFVSPTHRIFYSGKFMNSYELIKIKKAEYFFLDKKTKVYNILLGKLEKIQVNNLITESLDPLSLNGIYMNNFVLNPYLDNSDKSLAKELFNEISINIYENNIYNLTFESIRKKILNKYKKNKKYKKIKTFINILI